MPTYIKTGYWDKKAKAPDGWLDLDLFCSTHGGGITLTTSGSSGPATLTGTVLNIPDYSSGGGGVNIYNSDGTLTGNRILQGANNNLTFQDCNLISLQTFKNNKRFVIDNLSEQYINLSYFNLSSGIGNGLRIEEQEIKTYSNGFNNILGLKLDFANKVYQLGQLAGNNATTLKIDDAAAFPVQVSGTNVTQNTSGTASGKFLKIKVDGVDYVIELKNPS